MSSIGFSYPELVLIAGRISLTASLIICIWMVLDRRSRRWQRGYFGANGVLIVLGFISTNLAMKFWPEHVAGGIGNLTLPFVLISALSIVGGFLPIVSAIAFVLIRLSGKIFDSSAR
ncbi:hypothetical protein [Burkholderia ubonensis]|uniref:hypothetical protein n=1 Tax=Burkholderia ubonensis TaxID=101571 RepID=UPI000AFB72F4|nr:hypothetical protein [Burkholderia ubonensis]